MIISVYLPDHGRPAPHLTAFGIPGCPPVFPPEPQRIPRCQRRAYRHSAGEQFAGAVSWEKG